MSVKSIELAAMIDFEWEGDLPDQLKSQLDDDLSLRRLAQEPPSNAASHQPNEADPNRSSGQESTPSRAESQWRVSWESEIPPGRGISEILRKKLWQQTEEKKRPQTKEERLVGLCGDYGKGEDLLWYRHVERPGGDQSADRQWSEVPLFDQRYAVYQTLPWDEPQISEEPTVTGLRFLILPHRRAGVATVWASYPESCSDPSVAKHQADQWLDKWEASKGIAESFGLANRRKPISERVYPFLAVRVDDPDLTEFCQDRASDVAAWFTGGYENESLQRRRELVGPSSNLSQRSYERLFMRWTEALALYNTTDEAAYRETLFRAAQLFEHCILTRRIFRSAGEDIAQLSPKVSFLTSFPFAPNWSKSNEIRSVFSRAEFDMVTAPPVQSVEAEDLVNKAIERFGIPALVEDTRHSYDLLDRRFQWFRTQWLAAAAVCAFLVNAVIALVIGILKK